MLVCLQPLSQYKKKGLYRYVETFELADPSLFEDAVITENLCICTLKKDIADKYAWIDMTLASYDQKYIEYYKWNIKHNKGLFMKQSRYKQVSYFDTKLDFLETSRCFKSVGGGFGKEGLGYRWNILHNYSSVNAHNGQIRMPSERARDNLAICWYSGDNNRKHLLGRVIAGVHSAEASSEYYFAIPQIDWEHISDNPLWKAGNYDEAVLSEMGLKFDENGVIAKC